MSKINRPSWVITQIKRLPPSSLYALVCTGSLLAVCCLYVFCITQPVIPAKIPAVIAPQPVYNHFCRCSCCTASAISPFLIKLPRYMPNQPSRLVIYASDIRQLTGCSKRTSHRQLSSLKVKLHKEAHQYVTIEEYCIDMGLNYEKTLQQLKLK